MCRYSDAARDIVHRHPAPAVSVTELQELLARELPTSGLEFLDPSVIQRLAAEARPLRVMAGPGRRSLSAMGSEAWVMSDSETGDPGLRSLRRHLKASVRRLARGVDLESALAWARWNRLLEEERALRRQLARRERARARRKAQERTAPVTPPGAPTTNPPPGPRPGGRIRPGSPRPRSGTPHAP